MSSSIENCCLQTVYCMKATNGVESFHDAICSSTLPSKPSYQALYAAYRSHPSHLHIGHVEGGSPAESRSLPWSGRRIQPPPRQRRFRRTSSSSNYANQHLGCHRSPASSESADWLLGIELDWNRIVGRSGVPLRENTAYPVGMPRAKTPFSSGKTQWSRWGSQAVQCDSDPP